MQKNFSIVLPAKNESASLNELLPQLKAQFPAADILVIDDGSQDQTRDICQHCQVRVISHPYNMGNGSAIKTGARNVVNDILIFMDADGQHNPDDIPRLLAAMDNGYDMVVGARNSSSQANLARGFANRFYNWLATWMTGNKIPDLTSGFRAVKTDKFKEFLYLLPNGFSYPTTITMAFFRSGYPVAYVPINANKRLGKSHIKLFKDGFNFLLIIFKISTLYSPLKIFLPISLSFFLLGLGYYSYTFFTVGRFTNMSALLLSTSVIIFLIGLVSEQITSLIYRRD